MSGFRGYFYSTEILLSLAVFSPFMHEYRVVRGILRCNRVPQGGLCDWQPPLIHASSRFSYPFSCIDIGKLSHTTAVSNSRLIAKQRGRTWKCAVSLTIYAGFYCATSTALWCVVVCVKNGPPKHEIPIVTLSSKILNLHGAPLHRAACVSNVPGILLVPDICCTWMWERRDNMSYLNISRDNQHTNKHTNKETNKHNISLANYEYWVGWNASSVLFSFRTTDIDTGEWLMRNSFMRGYDVSTKNETFFITHGTATFTDTFEGGSKFSFTIISEHSFMHGHMV